MMLTPTLTLVFRSPIRLRAALTDIPQYATQATWQVADNAAFSGTLIVDTTTSADGWAMLEYAIPSGDSGDTFYIRARVGGDVPTLDENGGVALDENGDEIYTFTESAWATYVASAPEAGVTTPAIALLGSTPQRIGITITNYPGDVADAIVQFSTTSDASTRWNAGNVVHEATISGTDYEYRVAEASRDITHYARVMLRRISDFDGDGPVREVSAWSSTLTITRAGAIRPVDIDYDLTAYTTSGTHTYTVPTGARQVRVTLVGAGGGGGGGNGKTTTARGGSGGGGGMIIERWLVVTPGTSLTVTVGAGGAGGSGATSAGGNTAGSAGGATSIAYSGTTLLRAYGGQGGGTGSGAGGAGGGTLDQSSGSPSGWIGASDSSASTPEYGGGGGGGGGTSAAGSAGGSSAHGAGGGGGGGGVSSGAASAGGAGGDGSSAGPMHAGSAGLIANGIAPTGGGGDDATDPIYCGGGGGGGGGGSTQNGTTGRAGGRPGGGGGGGGGGGSSYNGGAGGAGARGAAYILAI